MSCVPAHEPDDAWFPRAILRASVAVLLATESLAAQKSTTAEPDTAAITPAMVTEGRAIFHGKGICFACHGMKLEGTQAAPTLIKSVWKDAKGGDLRAIHYVVTHGVAGTIMVAYPGGITPAEAISVASYIWSVNNRKVKP